MDLERIAARITAGQSVKSAIESDNDGFTKAVQDVINYHFMGKDIDIQLLKVEIANGQGQLQFSGGGTINFDTSQEYSDFLKDLPSAIEGGRIASEKPLTEEEEKLLAKANVFIMDWEMDDGKIPPEIDFPTDRELTPSEARKILDWFYITAPGDY